VTLSFSRTRRPITTDGYCLASCFRKPADPSASLTTACMGPAFAGRRRSDCRVLRKFPDSNFKQPRRFVPAPPRELGFWLISPFLRGDGTPKGALGNGPRLISRIAGKQRHTATPLSVPPRRLLRPWDRASGTRRGLRHDPEGFRLSLQSRPAIEGRAPYGPGRLPKAPDAMFARHSRRRRIRPAWVTPPRPSFRSVPLQNAS